jgi:transposase
MSKPTARVFTRAFKQAAVTRIEAGERLRAVADDLGVRRKLLYDWRAAWRAEGVAGFNKKRGPRPRPKPQDQDNAGAANAELALARQRIAELERKIGQQAVELDFFRQALRLGSGRKGGSCAPASTTSSRR